jgi:hypothetical protein
LAVSDQIIASSKQGRDFSNEHLLSNEPFTFTVNEAAFQSEIAKVIALSPSVLEQLSTDACVRTFALRGAAVLGFPALSFRQGSFGWRFALALAPQSGSEANVPADMV